MKAYSEERNLTKTLIILTAITILFQIVMLWINSMTSDFFDTLFRSSISLHVIRSTIFIIPFLFFILAQLALYGLAIFFIWYVSRGIAKLFQLTINQRYALGLMLWFVTVIFIAAANDYYVPHSFFAKLLSSSYSLQILLISGDILIISFLLSLFILVKDFSQHYFAPQHIFLILFCCGLVFIKYYDNFAAQPKLTSPATANKPNIFIIGIDALRPDFIDYYSGKITTPFIDKFLLTSVSFSNSYTPLARTFPSWTTILTGRYPMHTHARGNNIRLDSLDLQNTLATYLQQQHYQTYFSTDDTRFNNITTQYGFDKIITPPMGLNDFLLGTINDFPLSNLIVPTALGRLLFPYSYANHGVAQTYKPKNYLQFLSEALHERADKPLFLAVHFTVSHWPYFWYNDHQAEDIPQLQGYQVALQEADRQVAKFFNLLQQNHLLDHAIVILLSDHGVSMGLPGDRLINRNFYQGNSDNIKKIASMRYYGRNKFSVDFKNDWGIDTTYGYGGDVLSLKQTRNLFALKSFASVDIGKARDVTETVSTMDITPTILNLLHIQSAQSFDGISLLPTHALQNSRPLFFESTYNVQEIQKEKISPEKVLIESLQLYDLDKKTGLIYYKPLAEKAMLRNKQEAIMQNGWLLAHYPRSQKLTFSPASHNFTPNIEPGYYVLVNLQTKAWTTELNSSFAKHSPVVALQRQLSAFYGKERTGSD